MPHYEQVFGTAFERRESKCCGVLMKYRREVKGEQVITLQIAQQLKTKNINVVPGQLFVVSVKLNFCQRQTQTNTKEKAPINRHFTCQHTRIYENFKEQYF